MNYQSMSYQSQRMKLEFRQSQGFEHPNRVARFFKSDHLEAAHYASHTRIHDKSLS